jgi:hypothetical protein
LLNASRCIDWKHQHNSSTLATIEYQPREMLVQNELQQARKESRAPDLSNVPAGGRVRVHLHSHNPQSANPKNFNFVVADKDDHVINQESGSDKAATPVNPTAKSSPKVANWEGVHTIDLQKPLQDQVKVHVINKDDQHKEDYTISHPTFKPQPAHVIDKDHPPGPAPVVR